MASIILANSPSSISAVVRSIRLRANLLVMVTLLSACATTLPTTADLKPIPVDRIFAKSIEIEDRALLTVLRDKSFAGSAVNYRLLIDGVLSAKISAGEYAVFELPAGEHIIEVRHPSAMVGAIGDAANFRAEPRGKYYFRINSDLGQIRLLQTTSISAIAPQ